MAILAERIARWILPTGWLHSGVNDPDLSFRAFNPETTRFPAGRNKILLGVYLVRNQPTTNLVYAEPCLQEFRTSLQVSLNML